MERLPLVEREILIRYGQLAPHARDRVLDQFYLLVPGCASLQAYLLAQSLTFVAVVASLLFALVSIEALCRAFFNWNGPGLLHNISGLTIIYMLEAAAIIYIGRRRWRYQKRYQEKLFQTTEIGLSAERISLHSRIIHGGSITKSMNWCDVASVQLVDGYKQNKGETLVLHDTTGGVLALHLDFIQTIEERQILRDFLKDCLGHIDVRPVLTSLLRVGKPDDIPFTKLWCQALQDARPRRNSAPLRQGAVLQNERFMVVDCIGGGGQGTVYEAEMRDLDGTAKVVLKEYVLPDAEHIAEHKAACEQFEREIRILGKVRHAGVIKLIDAFVEDHRAYLVLEHVDGVSLKDYVHKHGPLDEEKVVELGIQACEILEYLHGMRPSLMHLDFSPENLLFDGRGRMVLIDFNISAEENSIRTRTVMGKQRYMAPEQYRGQPQPVSDLYSLGATLSFLLTGVEPEPISVAKPAKHRPELSAGLASVIAQATALDERERIGSAAKFKQALQSLEENGDAAVIELKKRQAPLEVESHHG